MGKTRFLSDMFFNVNITLVCIRIYMFSFLLLYLLLVKTRAYEQRTKRNLHFGMNIFQLIWA